MYKVHSSKLILVSSLLLPLLISACSDSDKNTNSGTSTNTDVSYRVVVTNLSGNQPISPVGVAVHGAEYKLWTAGQAASEALEKMAEDGNSQPWLDSASGQGAVTALASAAISPGGQSTVDITGKSDMQYLTVAGMLVNTNDAFSGALGLDLSSLTATGQKMSYSAPAYDAGTEANSEQAGTIPGPADGGEGFNSERDDVLDKVRIHAGVIGVDDGLVDSVLNSSHRFDNPAMRIEIERL